MHEPAGRAVAGLEPTKLDRHDHPRLHVVLGPNGVINATPDAEGAAALAGCCAGWRHVEYVAVRTHANHEAA
ncbi:hypothetical protein [Patulibacter minatonensis]|uniref:hypothetical protein n=1 Tax=Patulibacter minatonensis TaxID=298163 RepID=UPI0012FAB987|nr:hypothetical protein [Patulibacter minatonensis]